MLKKIFNVPLVIALLGLTLFLGSSPIYGQSLAQSTNPQYYWITAGAGGSTFDLAGGASASYLYGDHLFSARFVYNKKYEPLAPDPSNTVWDVSALYGRKAKVSYGFASISTGFGIVGGVRRGEFIGNEPSGVRYEKNTFLTYGIPLEGQLFWTPVRNFGIGIYAFANYNPEESFVGGLISIQIGKMHGL